MYAFNIEYHHTNGHISSVSGASTNLDTARRDLAHHIEYYTTECPVIIDLAEVVLICAKCNGAGELVKHYKHNKLMVKRSPCPSCDGKGVSQYEKWEVVKP